MKQLDELFDYKNKLMEDLLTNNSIVNLINENVSLEDAHTLAYTQVFPYEYIPETIEEARTYVFFDVDIQKSLNKTFLIPTIFVWVISHKSRLKLPEGGVQTDKLCSEIAEVINGSRNYGLGELELYSVKRFSPMTDYQGKVMMFMAKDFNRPAPSKHKAPSNRKDF